MGRQSSPFVCGALHHLRGELVSGRISERAATCGGAAQMRIRPMSTASLYLIYNPAAANGRTARLAPRVASALGAAGYAVTVAPTEGPRTAGRQVREALSAGTMTVAVLGGDGTLHEAVDGFVTNGEPTNPSARLIVLSAGTGGNFARTLGLPRDPMAGVAALAHARPVSLDLGVMTCTGLDGQPREEAFINIANVGLAGDVVAQVNWTTKALAASSASWPAR